MLSRNFEAEMHTLLLNASSLLVISGGTGEEAAPTDADQLDTVR